jgi:sulfite exporter TauE/SafE
MEEQPSFEPDVAQVAQRPSFIKRLGRVLAFSVVGAALYALVLGPRNTVGLANGLFWIGAILLLIALFPMFSDVINRSTVTMRSRDQSFEDIMQDARQHSEQGDTLTFLFGVSGMIVVALSFILGFV